MFFVCLNAVSAKLPEERVFAPVFGYFGVPASGVELQLSKAGGQVKLNATLPINVGKGLRTPQFPLAVTGMGLSSSGFWTGTMHASGLGSPQSLTERRSTLMDASMIRTIAGVLAVIVLAVIIYRRKKASA